MHIWPKTFYPALSYNTPPDFDQLTGSTTVFVHHFQDHANSHVDTVYKPDPRVVTQFNDMQLTIGPSSINNQFERFKITNLNLEVTGGCDIPQAFTMDVWATESESMNTVHCLNTGKDFFANNPKITGLLFCGIPRQYNVQITSIDPVPMNINYDVYVDNGDFNFNKVEDTLKIKTVSGISISSSQGYNSGVLSYLPHAGIYPYANMNLWVEVSSTSLPNTVIYGIENNCSALPIILKSFTAKKIGENVHLNWITTAESGNKGFYIERKIGNQEWQTIGFVNSMAPGGNSNLDIVYNYIDPISIKAIIQYRLRQTDLDGKFEYSLIRVIRNEGIEDIVIFPNPSSGNISLVFNNTESKYQVTLFSTEGKLIKKWQNCNALLTINGLKAGMYFVKIENILNKEIVTRKIVIQ